MSNLERINIGTGYAASLDVYSLVPCPVRVTSLQTHGKAVHRHATKFYNLQSLDYKDSLWNIPLQLSFETRESLAALTHLTSLRVMEKLLHSNGDYQFLNDLPLRELEYHTDDAAADNCYGALSRLTDLQALTVRTLSAEQVAGLSSLQHLTRLYLYQCHVGVNGENFTLLTSLQYLNLAGCRLTALNSATIERQMPNLVAFANNHAVQ